MKVKVSVIIPTWNGLPLLKICLPSLKKQTYKNIEIIIIDNGSTDGSVNFVKQKFPEVNIITLKKNYGFSKAVNFGIKRSKGRYVFLLNNDTKIDKDCLMHLIGCIKKYNVEFVTGKFMYLNKKDTLELTGHSFVIDSVGHLYSTADGKKDAKKYNFPGFTFLASGGGSLYLKSMFSKIGYLDESYFLYYEDADLSLRAQLAGFKGWYEPKAKIYHVRMASARKQKQLNYFIFRNMTMTIIKDFPISIILRDFNLLKIILVHLNTIRFLAIKGYLWQALKADWYILTHLRDLLKKRKKIQSMKKVSDDYIYSNIVKKRIKIPLINISF